MDSALASGLGYIALCFVEQSTPVGVFELFDEPALGVLEWKTVLRGQCFATWGAGRVTRSGRGRRVEVGLAPNKLRVDGPVTGQ